MKTVTRVKMNGKTYLTTKASFKALGRAEEYPVIEDIYRAVCEYDRMGKVYEEKSEKWLSERSTDLLYHAMLIILQNAPRKLRYREAYDFLSMLLYTIEEWEKETTE